MPLYDGFLSSALTKKKKFNLTHDREILFINFFFFFNKSNLEVYGKEVNSQDEFVRYDQKII